MKRLFTALLLLLPYLAQSQEFPKDWIGSYEGTMVIGNIAHPNDSVRVSFEVRELSPDSSWTYLMTFDSPRFGKIVKDYVIRKTPSTNPHLYVLDERDGIEIDMSYLNGCFYSVFELNNSLYTTTMRAGDNQILFDLFITHLGTPHVTHSAVTEEDEVSYEIISYPTSMHQTVVLKRQ